MSNADLDDLAAELAEFAPPEKKNGRPASEERASDATSWSSRRAPCGSRSISFPARSALREMTVREWPRMSCRSRAIRLRSS